MCDLEGEFKFSFIYNIYKFISDLEGEFEVFTLLI